MIVISIGIADVCAIGIGMEACIVFVIGTFISIGFVVTGTGIWLLIASGIGVSMYNI